MPRARAQLNRSNEIIETIQDIELQDDSKKTSDQTKPKNDEEFQKEKISPEQQVEDEIDQNSELQQAEKPSKKKQIEEQEETVERKEVPQEKNKSYEDELKKNALKNQKKVEDDMNGEDNGFVVDKPKEAPLETKELPTEEESEQQEQKALQEEQTPPDEQEQQAEEKSDEEDLQKNATEQEERVAEPEAEPSEESVAKKAVIPEAPEEVVHEIPAGFDGEYAQSELDKMSKETKVEIEPNPYEGTTVITGHSQDYLKAYRDRKPAWTVEFDMGTSNYEPKNYFSDIVTANTPDGDYKELYTDKPQAPLTSLGLEFKRNFDLFSVSAGLSFGYFQAVSDNATLGLMVPSVHANIYFDDLFREPYIVPYVIGGYSYFMYKENFDDGATEPVDVKGNTDNFFVGFGLLFQLDWIDSSAHRNAYNEMGLQNTFIFVEGRTYLDKGIKRKEEDPDFSAGTFIAGGLKFEF